MVIHRRLYLVLEVELLLDGGWGGLGGRQDRDGVSRVGLIARLTIADDEESVRTLAVVDEVADEDRVRIFGDDFTRDWVVGQLVEVAEDGSG